MVLKAIIVDWNGTLISDRNEMPILRHIAVGIARQLLPFHPVKIARILKARQELSQIHTEGKNSKNFDYVRKMYQVYNDKILEGTPMSVIEDTVEDYASKADVRERLDYRILNVLRKYHDEKKICGILSAGYGYGIDRILAAADYRSYFDFLFADKLVENEGKAQKLLLQIYRNKGPLLRNLMEEKKINPDETVYIGDTQDDEDCFQLVKYPVVSFFAPDDFKKYCIRKHQAFVPEGEEDLIEFFKKIDK